MSQLLCTLHSLPSDSERRATYVRSTLSVSAHATLGLDEDDLDASPRSISARATHFLGSVDGTPAKNKTKQEKDTTHTLRQARASRPDSHPRPLAPRLTAARSNSRLFGSAMVDTLCEVGGREQVGWACLPCALPSEKATPQLGAPRFRPLLVSEPSSCKLSHAGRSAQAHPHLPEGAPRPLEVVAPLGRIGGCRCGLKEISQSCRPSQDPPKRPAV